MCFRPPVLSHCCSRSTDARDAKASYLRENKVLSWLETKDPRAKAHGPQ